MRKPISKGRPGKNESRPLHSQGMWWRLYARDLQRRDIQTLPDDVFRTWVGLGCLASMQNGLLPSIRDAAFELRMSEHSLECHIGLLIQVSLIKQSIAGKPALVMADWSYRQFGSDNSTQRTQKHKLKRSQSADSQPSPDAGNVPDNVPGNENNIVSHSASPNLPVDRYVLPSKEDTELDDRDVPVAAYGHVHGHAHTDGRRHGRRHGHADVGTGAGTDGHTSTDGHGCEHGRACHDIDAAPHDIDDEMLADAKQRRREGQP